MTLIWVFNIAERIVFHGSRLGTRCHHRWPEVASYRLTHRSWLQHEQLYGPGVNGRYVIMMASRKRNRYLLCYHCLQTPLIEFREMLNFIPWNRTYRNWPRFYKDEAVDVTERKTEKNCFIWYPLWFPDFCLERAIQWRSRLWFSHRSMKMVDYF